MNNIKKITLLMFGCLLGLQILPGAFEFTREEGTGEADLQSFKERNRQYFQQLGQCLAQYKKNKQQAEQQSAQEAQPRDVVGEDARIENDKNEEYDQNLAEGDNPGEDDNLEGNNGSWGTIATQTVLPVVANSLVSTAQQIASSAVMGATGVALGGLMNVAGRATGITALRRAGNWLFNNARPAWTVPGNIVSGIGDVAVGSLMTNGLSAVTAAMINILPKQGRQPLAMKM